MDVSSAALSPGLGDMEQEDAIKIPLDRHGLKDDQSPMEWQSAE